LGHLSYAPFSSKNSIRLFFTQIQSLYTFLLLLSVNQIDTVLSFKEQLPDEMIASFQDVLNGSVELLVKEFIKSDSFFQSRDYSNQLRSVLDFLTLRHKNDILNAFFNNDQIYNAVYVPPFIKVLFDYDMNNSDTIQSYWLDFRKNLDTKFPNRFKELTSHIDNYLNKSSY
jgi:hypothetical protein